MWLGNSLKPIWEARLWDAACTANRQPVGQYVLGCRVASIGDQPTVIVGRRDGCVLVHERHFRLSMEDIAHRFEALSAMLMPAFDADRQQFGCVALVSEEGIGATLVDQCRYGKLNGVCNVVGVAGCSRAIYENTYVDRRTEIAFAAVNYAYNDDLDVSRLDELSKMQIWNGLAVYRYNCEAGGRFKVESAYDMTQSLGAYPCDAYAFNLCFAPLQGVLATSFGTNRPRAGFRGWPAVAPVSAAESTNEEYPALCADCGITRVYRLGEICTACIVFGGPTPGKGI